MSVRRIDQGMALAAAQLLPDRVTKELRTRYRQLRIMTHTAGLAATYAFIAAKAGESNDLAIAYRRAGQGIRRRLGELGLLTGDAERMSARAVLDQLGGMDPVGYARASAEATTFLGWLARLADAEWQAAGSGDGGAGEDGHGRDEGGAGQTAASAAAPQEAREPGGAGW
jgi:CRISPR-associated protein Cmr5